MPRLPTMRVIGSQCFSTSVPRFFSLAAPVRGTVAMSFIAVLRAEEAGNIHRVPFFRPIRLVAGRVFGPVVSPQRFLIDGAVGELAQVADQCAVGPDQVARQEGARR